MGSAAITFMGSAAIILIDLLMAWMFSKWLEGHLQRKIQKLLPKVEQQIITRRAEVQTLLADNWRACVFANVRFEIFHPLPLPHPITGDAISPAPMVGENPEVIGMSRKYIEQADVRKEFFGSTDVYTLSIPLAGPADVLYGEVEEIMDALEGIARKYSPPADDFQESAVFSISSALGHLRETCYWLEFLDKAQTLSWLRQAADDLAFIVQSAAPASPPLLFEEGPPGRDEPLIIGVLEQYEWLGAMMEALAGLESLDCYGPSGPP